MIRSLLPILRTLPSSTVDTLSFLPISPMSSFLPLKANEEVRDATRSAWIFDRALMISSAMPSVKYSFSGSLLMLAKGSTATDFAAETTGAGITAVSLGVCRLSDARALTELRGSREASRRFRGHRLGNGALHVLGHRGTAPCAAAWRSR